jgi:xylose dehydrogenase (NAD/NADP)
MATLRWGILGAANIARKAVIPAIQESNNGRVVAIASRSRARAEQIAQALEIPNVFDDYTVLLHSPGVDAVYIPLPNSEHHRWTIAAVEAGKHVLCEKPLAMNATEAEEMAAAAARARVVLAEAFMYRHHPLVEHLLALLHGGLIGELTIIRSSFSFHLQSEDNIRLSKDLGGGALMDIGCYPVSLARLVTGAEPVVCAALAAYAPSGIDEAFVGAMRFPDGVLAQFDVSFKASGGSNYELIGTTGKLVVRQGFKPEVNAEGEIQLHQQGEISRIFTEAADQYRLMVEDFAAAVFGERLLRYPVQDAIANMRAIDALRDAAERPEKQG